MTRAGSEGFAAISALAHGRDEDAANIPLQSSPIHFLPLPLARDEWACAFVSSVAGWGVKLLSIAILGVPFKPGMIMPSFYGSAGICVIILSLMGMAIGVVVWPRRSNPELRRLPDTLAEICVLLAQGKIDGVSNGENFRDEDTWVKEGVVRENEEGIWHRAYEMQYQGRSKVKKGFIERTVEVGTAT